MSSFVERYLGKAIDADGVWLSQCVDVPKQEWRELMGRDSGVWGNAKDWWTNALKVADRIDVNNLRDGDYVVWGAYSGNPYGHVGRFIRYVKDAGGHPAMEIFEQNGFESKIVYSDEVGPDGRKQIDYSKSTYAVCRISVRSLSRIGAFNNAILGGLRLKDELKLPKYRKTPPKQRAHAPKQINVNVEPTTKPKTAPARQKAANSAPSEQPVQPFLPNTSNYFKSDQFKTGVQKVADKRATKSIEFLSERLEKYKLFDDAKQAGTSSGIGVLIHQGWDKLVMDIEEMVPWLENFHESADAAFELIMLPVIIAGVFLGEKWLWRRFIKNNPDPNILLELLLRTLFSSTGYTTAGVELENAKLKEANAQAGI